MAVKHFFEQEEHTRGYLLPYFLRHIPDLLSCKVLEIGCAEGGSLLPLIQAGIAARGIELSASRVAIALQKNPALQVQVGDITDPHLPGQIGEQFDLIIMRDVIEHVSDRETTMANLNALLSKSGYLYITFPPKYSAYGGHQQTASSAVRFIPFFHVLPAAAVQKIGGWFKEKPGALEQIRQIFQNGLTVAEFEKLCARHDLCVKIKGLFLSRPVFKIRYNLPVIPCPDLPLFREFMASGCEYLLQK